MLTVEECLKMKVSQQGKEVDNILSRDIYNLYLQKINGILFTRREIDIIACILAGRSAKKIASLLLISPKTVENHIRTVMLKLGCRSQESIIDFVEKSKEFLFVKKYYASLLIQTAFELELKKISALENKQNSTCLIVYDEEQKDKESLIYILGKNLKLAGINASVTTKESIRPRSTPIGYIFYNLTSTYLEKCEGNGDLLRLEVSNLKANINTDAVIFLLLDVNPLAVIPKALLDLDCINLAEYKNYYFLVFETLKRLLPNADLEKYVLEFKRQYEIFNDPSAPDLSPEKNKLLSTEDAHAQEAVKDKCIRVLKKNRRWPLAMGLFCLAVFWVCFNFFPLTKQKSQGINWNLPRQDHLFVGREKLLEELHAKLHDHKNLSEPRKINALAISACAGLGGIGKTQLALQYVYHTQYPYTLRAWFPAENKDQLHQKYIEFAKSLGYLEENISIEKAVVYIKSWLREHPGWLLVYDNVNTYEEIEPLLPEEGGHIIITTRNRHWPSKFNAIPVDIMTEDEAICLIKSLTKIPVEEKEIAETKELIKILGYLPLAIAQAGAYIQQNQVSIREYLKLYKNHEQALLENKNLPKGANSIPTEIIWNISLTKIAEDSKSSQEKSIANELLTVCAYLAPEKISRHILLTWLEKAYPNLDSPKIVLNDQLRRLGQYSMINFDGEEFISVHRLVQTVLRHRHKQIVSNKNLYCPSLSFEWYKTLLESIHVEFRREIESPEIKSVQQNLLPHLQSLENHFNELWTNTLELNFGEILHDIGYICYNYLGDSKLASSYLKRALLIKTHHYQLHHPKMAALLTDLGSVYKDLNEVNDAKKVLETALSISEQHYGKDHFKTAEILNHLSGVYHELGNVKKAKEISEHALEISERHYGPDHLEVASNLCNLGIIYRELGDTEKAIALLERALKIREQQYGKEHFKVAVTLTRVGLAYRNSGNYNKATVLLERALKIRQNYYGLYHFQTAVTLSYLGITYRALGEFKKAKELLEIALTAREHHFGRNHPITAKALNQLGIVYKDLGNFKEAQKLLENALSIKKQYYGEKHYEVAFSLRALGDVQMDLGNTKQAKELLKTALKIQELYYKENHLEVARTLLSLTKVCGELKEFSEAFSFGKKCHQIFFQSYGERHHETRELLDLMEKYKKKLVSS